MLYAGKWEKFFPDKLDKWVGFNLFWHATFSGGAVNYQGNLRRPEHLLIVR